MNLTTDELEQITELAKLFYTEAQVAIILELDLNKVKASMALPTSEFYRAYWKGWYTSDKKFREDIQKLSTMGSSPAQTLLAKIIDEAKLNRIDR